MALDKEDEEFLDFLEDIFFKNINIFYFFGCLNLMNQ